MPFDCINQSFVQQVTTMSEAAQVALCKKEHAEAAADGQTNLTDEIINICEESL